MFPVSGFLTCVSKAIELLPSVEERLKGSVERGKVRVDVESWVLVQHLTRESLQLGTLEDNGVNIF